MLTTKALWHCQELLKTQQHRFRKNLSQTESTEVELTGFLEGAVQHFEARLSNLDDMMEFEQCIFADPTFGTPPAPSVSVTKRKRRRVNNDPYGGDGYAWDDSDFFCNNDTVDDADASDAQQDLIQCAEALDRSITDDMPGTRSVAVHRLNQLQRQLASCSVSMDQAQELQLGEMLHWQQPQQTWWQDQQSYEPRRSSLDYTSQHPDCHVQHQPQQASREETDDEHEPQVFHCPYIDCHKTLDAQNQRSAVISPKRDCVHTGCTYRSTTSRAWLAHILAAHHDLQGVPIPEILDEAAEAKAML